AQASASERHEVSGAQAVYIMKHMDLPGLYADPVEEYWQLIKHVTWWDVSVERQVEISGKDGAKFAELFTPRNLTKCNVGQGKYVVITDENGGSSTIQCLFASRRNGSG